MPSTYYSKLITLKKEKDETKEATKDKEAAGKALLIFMDTDPFLHESKAEYVAKQMDWLKDTLKNTSADIKWKIVIGHHPFYTVGPRIMNAEILTMRKALKQLFDDNKVDVYLSGHEHSLQHLKPEGYTHQFISGAGSELTTVTTGIPYSKFQAAEHGFMYFSIDNTRLNVKAINYTGNVLYETELTK